MLHLSCVKQDNESIVSNENLVEFSDFWNEFIKSDNFQAERTIFPIKIAFLESDENYERIDTIVNYIDKKDYKIIDFQEKYLTFNNIEQTDSTSIVELGIFDTGVSILLNFVKRNNEWFLVEILDRSN